MPPAVTTKTEELGDSRVRVDVEVGADAVERQIAETARTLARDMKLPGFRKGKVPPQVVLQRIGRRAVLEEAVQGALPAWYAEAVHDAGLATVGDPKLDIGELPDAGAPLGFSIEIGVRPVAQLGEYRGLDVGRREPEVDPELVERELERLRESQASLQAVDRAAGEGDFLVLDFQGTVDGEPFEGGEARGYLLELGSGRLIEGFEEQLAGASAGDDRQVEITFPADYGAESLAGRDAVFAVSVKEVKEKQLPPLDDDLAVSAAGLDSLAELREEIASRLRAADEQRVEAEYREAAVDAAVERARIEVPKDLVHAKAHEMWHTTARRLARQGLDPATYLQVTGKTEEEIVVESEPDAERALRREAVLAAVVEAEGLEATDEDLLEALRSAGPPSPGEPAPDDETLRQALERAKAQGEDELLREDVAMRKAVDLLVEGAKPIAAERVEAREKIWTPEKDEPGGPGAGGIWTPDKG